MIYRNPKLSYYLAVVKEKKSKLLWVLLLALAVSLPFERLLTLDLFGYTVKISYLLAIAIVIYFVFIRLKNKIKDKVSLEEYFLAAYVLINFMTAFWTLNFNRTVVISGMIFLMVLLYLALKRLISSELALKIESTLVWVGVAISFFGFWQFLAGSVPALNQFSLLRPQYQVGVFPFPRIQSTLLEPLYLANFLLIPTFLAIKKYIGTPKIKTAWPVVVMSAAIFLTLSRGGIYALALGLIIVGVATIWRFKNQLKSYLKTLGIVLAGLVLAAAMFYASAGSGAVKTAAVHSGSEDWGAQEVDTGRTATMKAAWEEFKTQPIGIGTGTFGDLPQFKAKIATKGYQTVNNLYLEVLVESGFLGLLAFGAFLLLIFWRLLKKAYQKDQNAVYFLAIFVAIFFQYLTFSTIYITYVWFFLALATRLEINEA